MPGQRATVGRSWNGRHVTTAQVAVLQPAGVADQAVLDDRAEMEVVAPDRDRHGVDRPGSGDRRRVVDLRRLLARRADRPRLDAAVRVEQPTLVEEAGTVRVARQVLVLDLGPGAGELHEGDRGLRVVVLQPRGGERAARVRRAMATGGARVVFGLPLDVDGERKQLVPEPEAMRVPLA